MHAPSGSRGFTTIELLVVAAVLLLLMALALPALRFGREQARMAACLSNLRTIGAASQSYAMDEPFELVIPIHARMTRGMPASDYWLHQTAMWFSYGGVDATIPFEMDMGPRWLGAGSDWAAQTRPLNRYLFAQSDLVRSAEGRVFACPSDTGYPNSPLIDDSPSQNAERPCIDSLGNSYRASLYGVFPEAGKPYDGAFAIGPWGHRLSTIPDASRTVVFGEPTFFNMVGTDNGAVAFATEVVTRGWHGQQMKDNLSFADGSAHVTLARGYEVVDIKTAVTEMNVGANWDLISRGGSWRFDLWPTPGAFIWAADPGNKIWNPPYTGQPLQRHKWWPFVGAQVNLRR